MRFLLPLTFLVLGLNASYLRRRSAPRLTPKITDASDSIMVKAPYTGAKAVQPPKKVLKGANKKNSPVVNQSPAEEQKEQSKTANNSSDSSNSNSSSQTPPQYWWEHPELRAVDDRTPFAKGAYGAVYHAAVKENGRFKGVVIKTIIFKKNTFEERHREIQAVIREVENQKKINSPWVVRMFDKLWANDDRNITCEAALMMECGGIFSLRDLYRSSRVGRVMNDKTSRFERVGFFAVGITKGLIACHDQGILHRDIALKNIVISANGHIKLCDFGLSCRMNAHGAAIGNAGTPYYMSRRAYLGLPYGVDADFYGLGACLFALDQMMEPLAGVVHTLQELREWHERRGNMSELIPQGETDWRVICAISLLCDLNIGRVYTMERLALVKPFLSSTTPKCVLSDIQNLVADRKN